MRTEAGAVQAADLDYKSEKSVKSYNPVYALPPARASVGMHGGLRLAGSGFEMDLCITFTLHFTEMSIKIASGTSYYPRF